MSISLNLRSLHFEGSVNGYDYLGWLGESGKISINMRGNGGKSFPTFDVNSNEIDSVVATLLEIKAKLTGQYIVNELVDQSSEIVSRTEPTP